VDTKIQRLDGPREDRELYSGEPPHDISDSLYWMKSSETHLFSFLFFFSSQVKSEKVGFLGLRELWVRAIGVSSQWEGCKWEWGGGTIEESSVFSVLIVDVAGDVAGDD
jgi:hypothetical protein